MARPRTKGTRILRTSLKEYLEQGLSYREIGNILGLSRELVYYYAKLWNLRNLNAHKKYKEYCKTRLYTRKLINPLMSLHANASMDISEITFRRQRGKRSRSIRKYMLTFTKGKTYIVFMDNQRDEDIAMAITKLLTLGIINKGDKILVDKQLNSKLPYTSLKGVYLCNTPKWHASKSTTEKRHGFKTSVYAKFWRFKTSSYAKMDNDMKALLLKMYLESLQLNPNYEIINPETPERWIRELQSITVKTPH